MLETRNLCKIYKPKKGVPVKALDNINLKFPEKGMIFLLGKSGSGKSTLLNLLGGLDKYDDGEIIIKGVSSKDFKQQYFDSYRNTYVGFIFQEYNILDEFSVGANIALAIELQGRKATDEEINSILREVDLEGYGNRKPNELSGGQKQRVAIARALIKNPEIIMADEPTGALDSNTGKQVFDTLKKLSKDKLVIIVSHDREFSEQYADRIIELSDGHVISDVELAGEADIVAAEETEPAGLNFNGNIVEIAQGYHLTEEDRIAINNYVDQIKNGSVSLTVKSKKMGEKAFVNTDQSKIKTQDGSQFKLIKSKLPLRSAFKIGASGLKYKKVKLVFTIILSCVAFGLFGLADTFGSYNHVRTCTDSIIDSEINYASLVKEKKSGSGVDVWWSDWGTNISAEELETIEKTTGVEFTGVCSLTDYAHMYFMGNYNTDATLTESDMEIYANSFSGFAEITQEKLDAMGYELIAGRIPDGSKNEIAISKYVYETFAIAGYCEYNADSEETVKYKDINEYDDLIGKTLTLEGEEEYTITGIVDTKVDLDRYAGLIESTEGLSTAEELVNYALYQELSYITEYSLAGVAMVGEGFVDNLLKQMPVKTSLGVDYAYFYSENVDTGFDYITDFDEILEKNANVIWIDGEKTSLAENEIIVTSDCVWLYNDSIDMTNGETDYSSLKNESLKMYYYIDNEYYSNNGYKIVGIIDNSSEGIPMWYNTAVVSDELYELLANGNTAGEYRFVVGGMPESKSEITSLVEYCYDTTGNTRFALQNAVTYELDTVNTVLKALSKVFFWIGFGFAIFASLMLANFIGTSISYKKQEIGILRAIGSRSNDVFRIFFSESFIIAMINFILSSIGVGVLTMIINRVIRYGAGILITVLHFGIRQIILLLLVSIVIAAIASFIPVKKIASKKPIDAIRNR